MIYWLIGYMFLFIDRPFEVWPVLGSWRIERVYMIGLLVAWLLFAHPKRWIGNRLQSSFLLFWISVLLSAVASPYRSPAQEQVIDLYVKTVVFYLVMTTCGLGAFTLRRLIVGYTFVIGLYMTHSYTEYLHGRHEYRMGIPRMVGVGETYSDPNTFAATLVYSLPLSFAIWKLCTRRWHRILLVYYIVLTVVCVLKTGSRSGFFALAICGLVALPRLRGHKWIFCLIILAIPFSWQVLPPNLQDRFRTIWDSSYGPETARESAEGRTQGFKDGLKLWFRNPLIGNGPGSHGQALGHGMQSHNLYGQVLGELGSLGALAFGSIVAGFYLNALEARSLAKRYPLLQGSFEAAVACVIPLSILLLLVKGWADHNLFRYTWLWFGSFQSMALHALRQQAVALEETFLRSDDNESLEEGQNLNPVVEYTR